MAHTAPQAPSQETVQKAWHGWQTFIRFAVVSVIASALATAVVIALITR